MKIMNVEIKDPLVKGHPLHALLTDIPVGTLVAGNAFDLIGLITRRRPWRFAARAAHTCAFVSGGVTALVGLWDYQAIPREHPARRVGALHGYLNASVLALLLASLFLRRESRAPLDGRPDALGAGLGFAALAVLGVSGWLGGDMVYRQGWRVSRAEEAEQLEDALRQRGEANLIEQAHDTVEQYEREHTLIP